MNSYCKSLKCWNKIDLKTSSVDKKAKIGEEPCPNCVCAVSLAEKAGLTYDGCNICECVEGVSVKLTPRNPNKK